MLSGLHPFSVKNFFEPLSKKHKQRVANKSVIFIIQSLYCTAVFQLFQFLHKLLVHIIALSLMAAMNKLIWQNEYSMIIFFKWYFSFSICPRFPVHGKQSTVIVRFYTYISINNVQSQYVWVLVVILWKLNWQYICLKKLYFKSIILFCWICPKFFLA